MQLFVSLSEKVERSVDWVVGLLNRGESRLEWCRMATTAAGELVAAHAFDSWSLHTDPGALPTFVHLLGHRDESVAAALLTHDLRAQGARSVQARIVVEADAPPALRALRESQPALLAAAGFELEVNRVRLRWPIGHAPPARPREDLTFHPAATVPTDTVTRVFAEVGDGSEDHEMRRDRAALGRQHEATRRLDRARRRNHPPEWFAIATDPKGQPVGYVQSATAEDGHAVLAEIGVVQSRRGYRYVDDLLAYGTLAALRSDATLLLSDTDQDNHAMRAAFARAGYVEFASRRDFRWVA